VERCACGAECVELSKRQPIERVLVIIELAANGPRDDLVALGRAHYPESHNLASGSIPSRLRVRA